MLTVYLITFALFIGLPALWVMVRMTKWSAPLAAIGGLGLLVLGAHLANTRMMAFGGGLFLFASVLFCLGGGMENR